MGGGADGGDCAAAARCCEVVFETNDTNCERMKELPAIACGQALKSMKESAKAAGKTCE